jgi:DNA-binding transcriptional LysR family regulator
MSNSLEYPTLRQLELFLSLTQSDGISSAGARLGMSPSATSHALRALETTLGVTLIDRAAPGAPLTYAGEHIVPHVRDVFASLELIKATARSGAQLKTGLLRIGSFGASATLQALPPVLKRFGVRYPGVEVHITEKPDEQTTQDLIERRIELAVITLPKRDLETMTLTIDELVAVLPVGHALAKLDVIPLETLVEQPFLLTRAGSQPLIKQLFAKHALKPRIRHELLQLMSILEYVARGHGVSILARLALPSSYKGVVYRPIEPGSSRHIGLACVNLSRLSLAAREFWREAERASAELRRSAGG